MFNDDVEIYKPVEVSKAASRYLQDKARSVKFTGKSEYRPLQG